MKRWIGMSLLVVAAVGQLAAQGQSTAAPRAADGKPDLSGIWQVLNTAAWDIQDHARVARRARRARAWSRATRFRISRAALAQEARELREPPHRRSGDEVLSAGRAAHHVHAVSVSDRPDAHLRRDPVRVHPRHPPHLHGRHAAPEGTDRQLVDGRFARATGRATRWSSTSSISPTRPGSIAPAIFTATRCTSSSATRRPIATTCSTRRRSRIRRCSRGRGR